MLEVHVNFSYFYGENVLYSDAALVSNDVDIGNFQHEPRRVLQLHQSKHFVQQIASSQSEWIQWMNVIREKLYVCVNCE